MNIHMVICTNACKADTTAYVCRKLDVRTASSRSCRQPSLTEEAIYASAMARPPGSAVRCALSSHRSHSDGYLREREQWRLTCLACAGPALMAADRAAASPATPCGSNKCQAVTCIIFFHFGGAPPSRGQGGEGTPRKRK